MTYGTSHLLTGGGEGGVFSGGGSRKNIAVLGGGHYMKNKNIWGCVLSTQPDQQKKAPMQKCAKNAKNYQTLKKFSSLVSLTRHFTKFIFLEQLTAMLQFSLQNMFFFCFLSSHHDTNPLLHLYHFRKNIIIYWLILTVSHQGSYFPFFYLHPVGQTFLYPSKFCIHLKHCAK